MLVVPVQRVLTHTHTHIYVCLQQRRVTPVVCFALTVLARTYKDGLEWNSKLGLRVCVFFKLDIRIMN